MNDVNDGRLVLFWLRENCSRVCGRITQALERERVEVSPAKLIRMQIRTCTYDADR